MRIAVALTFALAVTAASTGARADSVAMAQALFDQGKKAMASQDYAEACPKFKESYRLQEALGTLLNLADCYEHQGKLASSWGAFLEVAAAARRAGQRERAEIARRRAAALAPRLSNLVIEVPAQSRLDGLEIREDGVAVGEAAWGSVIPSDSGAHTFEVSAPGRKSWSRTVVVDEAGGTARLSVPELEPSPVQTSPSPAAPAPVSPSPAAGAPVVPAPSPAAQSTPSPSLQPMASGPGAQRIAGWIVGGAGVLGVGAAGVLGLVAKNQFDHAENEMGGPRQTDSSQAVKLGNVATIVAIGGAATAVAGIIVWLTAPRSTIQVGTNGQQAFVSGRF